MSEVSETLGAENPQVEAKSKASWDDVYARHFGSLSFSAARLNMEAFCDDDGNRSLAMAWLNKDKARVKEIAGDISKKERNELVRQALTKVTNQLVTHTGTVRYRDMLPESI